MIIKKVYNALKNILHINNLHNDVERLKCENDYLKTLFKMTVDITKAPKARGTLRLLQLGDLAFLKIFDRICNKHNLSYWLDSGTLLGAVRHGGFIPWDDDIDVAMLRKDYNKAIDIFRCELPQDKYEINEGRGFYNKVVRIIYKDSPFQIDIWPFDEYKGKITTKEEKDELCRKIIKCNSDFWKKYDKDKVFEGKIPFPRKELEEMTYKLIQKDAVEGKELTLFRGCETLFDAVPIFEYKSVFPLKKILFEDYEFNAPFDYDTYLTTWYGDYMDFPVCQLEGHKNIQQKYKDIEIKYNEMVNEDKHLLI